MLFVDSVAVREIEILEGLGNSGSFVLSFEGFLANLLIDDSFEFSDSFLRDVIRSAGNTPGFQHKVHKVILLLIWKGRVDIGIVLKELSLGNARSIAAFPCNSLAELIVHTFGRLISDSYPWVILWSELLL